MLIKSYLWPLITVQLYCISLPGNLNCSWTAAVKVSMIIPGLLLTNKLYPFNIFIFWPFSLWLCIVIINILQSGITQKRMGFLLSQIPFKVSSSCHFMEFFLATLTSGSLIRELDLHPNLYKVLFWQCLLFEMN